MNWMDCRTIILTKGIQASGKTTWALEQLKKFPGRFKRFNRDSMRSMVDGSQFLGPEGEKLILKICK